MRYVLAALSGLALAASFPPVGAWSLAWFALVPLLHAIAGCPTLRSAAEAGAFAGLVFMCSSLYWLKSLFGPVAAALWCVGGLVIAVYAAALWEATRILPLSTPGRELAWAAAAGVLWAGVEYFRSEVWWLRCPFVALGFSQTASLPMLQFCSLFGVYGLSALIASSNAAFSLLLKGHWKAAALWSLAVACAAGWGRWRLARYPAEEGRLVRVALVQDESFEPGRLIGLSLSPEARDAQLLVWPEGGYLVEAGEEEAHKKFLADKLRESKATKVLGVVIPGKAKDQDFAWIFSPAGKLLGRHDKMHPVPLMERLVPNRAPRPVETDLGKLGVQICYDLDAEDGTRKLAGQGAQLLVVPSEDPLGWGKAEHLQHSAMAPARAVESGLWIVRAASSGMSQIIDPTGRIRASLPVGASGVLVGAARLRAPGTFYSAFGWLFVRLSLVAVLATFLWVLGTRWPPAVSILRVVGGTPWESRGSS